MNQIEKILLLWIISLISLTCIAHDAEVDGICYNLNYDTKEASVTNKVNNRGVATYPEKVIIPSSIIYNGEKYHVTSIGDSAFYRCKDIKSVVIPKSVKSIENDAFNFCRNLTSVKIPKKVERIGNDAFYCCSKIESIILPKSLKSIGEGAFVGCSFTKITIPKSVTNIEGCPFNSSILTSIVVEKGNNVYDSRNNCNAIIRTETNELIKGCTTTKIPDTVTRIGDYAFAACFCDFKNLASLTIPESVTSIGKGAFLNCMTLKSITIPSALKIIGDDAFMECHSLSSDINLKSVTSIGKAAFMHCYSLSHIIISSDSLLDIRRETFDGCRNLRTVVIPSSVEGIGAFAFSECVRLKSVINYSKIPQRIDSDTFYECNDLHVPKGCKDFYEKSWSWGSFTIYDDAGESTGNQKKLK